MRVSSIACRHSFGSFSAASVRSATWISTSAANSGLTCCTRFRADGKGDGGDAKPSGRGDSNSRPHGPEPCTLTWLSYFPAPGPDDTTRLIGALETLSHRAV